MVSDSKIEFKFLFGGLKQRFNYAYETAYSLFKFLFGGLKHFSQDQLVVLELGLNSSLVD